MKSNQARKNSTIPITQNLKRKSDEQEKEQILAAVIVVSNNYRIKKGLYIFFVEETRN
jgi:hypothetical protein